MDFEPQPADTSGQDFQESLFGREDLRTPAKLGWFGGILPRDDLGKNPTSDAIAQKLLYGSALAAHVLNSESPSERIQRELYKRPDMPWDSWEDRLRASAKSLDPEPGTLGVGTQALAGLAGFATQVAMGGGAVGGVLSVGSTSAYESYHNARDQGLDEATAEKMATAEGGSGALFAALPFGSLAKNSSLGLRLLAEASTGMGANTGIGLTTRYAQHKILADAGYPELAEQYKAFDRDSILMDAATGLFPAAHLAGTEGLGVGLDAMIRKTNEIALKNGRVRDAVSTTQDARAQRERQPGIPIDPKSAMASNSAEQTALVQTLNRQGVDLSNTPIDHEGATFLQPPQNREAMADARELFMTVLQEHVGREGELTPEERRVAEVLGVTVEAEAPAPAPVESTPKGHGVEVPEEIDPFATPPAEAPKPLPKRNTKTSDEREDSILEYLAKHGRGISSEEARAQGVDPKDINSPTSRVGIKRAFRKNGMTFDEAAERLAEAGYPVTDKDGNYRANLVMDAIDRELRGTPVHSYANTRRALEDEAMLRDRTEFDVKVPELVHLEPEAKDMAALETKARTIDNDRATEIMESWEKDDPETIARVRSQLEGIINGGEEIGRGEGGERAAGGGRPVVGQESETSGAPTSESLRTAHEHLSTPADTGTGAGFSDTGSDAGERFSGRDAALAREVIADRPDAVIVDEDGKAHPAADAIENAKALEDQANAEAAKAFDAAADCARRQA